MSALTIPLVRSWRPEVLDAAATDLGAASEAVEAQVRVLRSSLEKALEDAGGAWAASAARTSLSAPAATSWR